MSKHSLAVLQVTIASICFGFLGIFGKLAFAAGVSIGQLLSTRFLLATAMLAAGLALFRRDVFRLGARQTVLSLLMGLLGYAVFSSLYFTALEGLSVPLAVLLLYTFPFWTVVFNAFLGERPSPRALAGLAGALAGVTLLLWGEIRVGSVAAVLYGAGSGMTYSIYIILSGRFQKGVPALGSGFWIILGSAIALTTLHPPQPQVLEAWAGAQWMPLIGLAIVCTIIPLTLIQGGLQTLSSTETALLSMIEPVVATLAAAAILRENLVPRQLLGGTLVLLSLVLVSARKRIPPADTV